MQDDELIALLKPIRTVAIVGLSPREDRPSHDVARYLQAAGLRIVPVNPTLPAGTTILGESVQPDLPSAEAALTAEGLTLDVVDIFRRSDDVPPIVEQALQTQVKLVWLQLGIRNEAAAVAVTTAGRQMVMDRCLKIEWRRLLGSA